MALAIMDEEGSPEMDEEESPEKQLVDTDYALAGEALDSDSESDSQVGDYASKIRRLQEKLGGESSESEVDFGPYVIEPSESWGGLLKTSAKVPSRKTTSEGDSDSAVGSEAETGSWDDDSSNTESSRDLWQGLGGDLAEREQRRKELMRYLDGVLHTSGSDGEKTVQVPQNFQALVDGLAKQRKAETPLAWAEARVIGTPQGLKWARSEASDVENASEQLSERSMSSTLRPLSVNRSPELQRGFERIEQLDCLLAVKQALAEETARQIYPERFADEEQKAHSVLALRLAKRRMRRQAKVRRAMIARGLGSKRVSAGDYVARNMMLGPNARFFTLLPEEEVLVDELLKEVEEEEGTEDASYTTYASTGFDADGEEAMQLAAIDAKLEALCGHRSYHDSDSFSIDGGSAMGDFAGVGSMSRALPQEMDVSSRRDSASYSAPDSARSAQRTTPRTEATERPSTQRSDQGSESSKASKQSARPLATQKRRASSSGSKVDAFLAQTIRRSDGERATSEAGSLDPKHGMPRRGASEGSEEQSERLTNGGIGRSNMMDDYLREQRETREAAAKQEAIDKKIRALRTAEIPASLDADTLAVLLEQCREEQEALKQCQEMMRRISTPGFSDAPPSVCTRPSSGSKSIGAEGGSEPCRRTSAKSSEREAVGGLEESARKARKSSSGPAPAQSVTHSTTGLTEAKPLSKPKPTTSQVELPAAKGAVVSQGVGRETRPRSAEALLTLPAL